MALTKISTGMLKQDAASSDLNIDAGTLYLDVSNNRVGIANTSPSQALNITGNALATGWFRGAGGSASTPTFLVDGSTGMFRASSNDIGFSTAGSERMRIDSNGRVGIGVTSVSSSLHVYHATDNNLARFQSGDATAHIQFRDSNTTYIPSLGAVGDDLTFSVGNGAPERMRIDSSGNVGIGLSSNIDRKLHVENNNDYAVKFGGTSAGDFAIEIGQSQTNGSPGFNATAGSMKFSMAGTEAMRIDSSGNLLVGKTSDSSAVSTDGINLRPDGYSTFTATSKEALQLSRQGTDGDILDFYKGSTSVGSIQTKSSDLAIGTGDTGIRFVDGDDAILPHSITAIDYRNSGIGLGTSNFRFTNLYLSNKVYAAYIGEAGDTDTSINFDTADTIKLVTGGSERLRIDSSGRVGIGTTPIRVLDIATTTGGTIIHLTDDVTGHTATDGVDIQQEGTLFQILNREAGDIRFGTDNTERMRIDSSGNLLVGTTAATAYNNSSDVYGFNVYANGQIASSVNGAQAAYFNRQNSDGIIVDFRKDGSTVGSIGVNSSRPYLVNNVDGGIHLATDGYGRALLLPADQNGAPEDNLHHLGSSSYRWRDLYLSGTAYVDTVDANSLKLGDNQYIFLGDGNDGRLHFDGTDTLNITATNGTANVVNVAANSIKLVQANGTDFFTATANAEVVINEDSADINFRVESDSNDHMLFVDGGNNKVGFNISSLTNTGLVQMHGTYAATNTADYRDNNVLTLTANDPGTTADDSGINLAFVPVRSRGSAAVISVENTSTNKEGGAQMRFFTGGGGYPTALAEKMQLNHNNGVIFNETSVDQDFRVESNNNANMLYVDGGNDRVAIGTNTQNAVLTIESAGNGYATGSLALKASGSGATNYITNAGGNFYISHTGTSDDFVLNANELIINENSVDRDFRVESSNQANMFRVDAGTDRIGIKLITAEPTNTLDVNGDISFARTVSKKISTGAANNNYFVIYEKDFETSAFTTNQHWVRITAAGATNGVHASAEFYITFKQQSGAKYFNIVPIENTGLNIGYTYDASGGSSSSGKLKIFASAANFYMYMQVFATAREGNADENLILGAFPMTDTGSATAPSGMTTMAFPLNYGANKYQLSGYSSKQYVINEDSNDLDFRVESNNNANMFKVDAGDGQVLIATSSPFEPSNYGLYARNGLIVGNFSGTGNGFTVRRADSLKLNINHDSTRGFVTTGGNPLHFRTSEDANYKISMETNGVVINENGQDYDFRVESDGLSHALFVDASTDKIGIGESAPATYLDIAFTSLDQTDGIQIHNKQFGGYGGAVEWISRTAASLGGGSDRIAGQIQVAGANNWASDDNVESTMKFSLVEDNTLRNILELNPSSEVVINQDSIDMDFRVESDNDTHALFVEGSSGNVGIGTSSVTNNSVRIVGGSSSGTNVVSIEDSDASVEGGSTLLNCSFSADTDFSSANYIAFNDLGGSQGSITGNGNGSVAYNTTSDRRAKENIDDADDAGVIIDSIQVRKFDWKRSGEHQPYGMIAQELLESVPDAVHQPVNEEEMMGVDYSKLVPMLVKALQEARQEINNLKSRVEQLESQ